MRRKAKVDVNQPEIVKRYRDYGCSVAITSMLGKGFPDIIVARNSKTILVEIKDGSLPPSKRRLTKDEQKFRDSWKGCCLIIEDEIDVEESLKYL